MPDRPAGFGAAVPGDHDRSFQAGRIPPGDQDGDASLQQRLGEGLLGDQGRGQALLTDHHQIGQGQAVAQCDLRPARGSGQRHAGKALSVSEDQVGRIADAATLRLQRGSRRLLAREDRRRRLIRKGRAEQHAVADEIDHRVGHHGKHDHPGLVEDGERGGEAECRGVAGMTKGQGDDGLVAHKSPPRAARGSCSCRERRRTRGRASDRPGLDPDQMRRRRLPERPPETRPCIGRADRIRTVVRALSTLRRRNAAGTEVHDRRADPLLPAPQARSGR